jgi:hypothetical protein
MLVEDLVLLRPPGLWTALVVLATEFMRSRAALTRELNFVVEWLLVSGADGGDAAGLPAGASVWPSCRSRVRLCVVQVLWSIRVIPWWSACRGWCLTCASPPPAKSTTTGDGCETDPRDTEESNRSLNRRTLMLGGAMAAMVAALGARMRYLQVDQADEFKLLAEENRINIRLIPPAAA